MSKTKVGTGKPAEKFERFLPTILDVIYGLVITVGFATAIKISVPLSNLVPATDFDGIINALALILIYVLVISS